MPQHISLVIRDEPPELMNGRVIPVKGRELVSTPMLTKAWITMAQVAPVASRRPNWSGAYQAMCSPR
jgi:hypothetical protein